MAAGIKWSQQKEEFIVQDDLFDDGDQGWWIELQGGYADHGIILLAGEKA